MSKWLATAGCLALAFLGSYSVQTLEAQGPIREGVRRTGEAIVETGRAVAEGTRSVVRGAAEVATGGRIGGRETRYDEQGRRFYVDNNEMVRYDAQGRPIDANGRVIELQEGDQLTREAQPYESGYRGVEGQTDVGPTQHQQVFYDRCGRPFICENGRRVYVIEHAASQPQAYEARKPTLAEEPMPADQPAGATDEARDYSAAPPLPEGATAPALENSNQGVQSGNPDTSPGEPDPNPLNPGKSNVPGQQPGDNADTSTTNSAD